MLSSMSPAHAVGYVEIGDAGDLPATAQVVFGPANTALTSISGTLTFSNNISEGDMYRIVISSPSTFSATTTGFSPGVNNFDTQLFIFTLSGLGVIANDDDPSTGAAQSTIAAGQFTLPAASYYLLITGSGRFPTSSGGLIFPNFTDGSTDPTGVYGPTGPGGASAVTGFTGSSNDGGSYSIVLTGAQFVTAVPEPSTMVAMGFGLGLLCLARRRRSSPISERSVITV